MTPETEAQWQQLAKAALHAGKLAIAERCYAAVGNVAKAQYLRQVRAVCCRVFAALYDVHFDMLSMQAACLYVLDLCCLRHLNAADYVATHWLDLRQRCLHCYKDIPDMSLLLIMYDEWQHKY